MTRSVPALGALAGVCVLIALILATMGGGAAGPGPALAADPADPAMVLSDGDPCVAPCVRQGVVYGSATSKLNPDAGKQSLALDLYRSPRTPRANAKVVVLLHGGGFVTGDRTQMRVMAEVLSKAGFLVAAIQYRLVPKERNKGLGLVKDTDLVPASDEAEEDAVRAMKWIRSNAKELGASTKQGRYGVGGYSAGAIAALRVAIRAGDTSTPKTRRWRVGGAFSVSGAECGAAAEAFNCKPAYDEDDAPIQLFHGDADSIVSTTWGRDTCTSAVLRGGGCEGYFYPDQDHFWSSGTIFGGGKGLTKRYPAVAPTVAKFLRKNLN